jgi:hypothetical protein
MQFSHTSGTRLYILPEVIKLLVAKLVGRSPFLGTRNNNVWCGSWDTRH